MPADASHLAFQLQGLSDTEHSRVYQAVATQLHVERLAAARPEVAALLTPIVEMSRNAGRAHVERLLDGSEVSSKAPLRSAGPKANNRCKRCGGWRGAPYCSKV